MKNQTLTAIDSLDRGNFINAIISKLINLTTKKPHIEDVFLQNNNKTRYKAIS